MNREYLLQKFWGVTLNFVGYHNFTLTYDGTLPTGQSIVIVVGGIGDDDFYHAEYAAQENIACLYDDARRIEVDGHRIYTKSY